MHNNNIQSNKNIINSLVVLGGTNVDGVKEIGLTVDEFWNKYPFKIGDLVNIPDYDSKVSIISMVWDGQTVLYETAIMVNDEPECRVWYECEDLLKCNKY